MVSRVGNKTSPPPTNANGVDHTNADVEAPTGDRAARTLGLMNVPDTVKDARIRTLVEPYGRLVKIVLRPDHQGAIVEFTEVHNAGKAALALEGQEIAAGRRLHVGTVPEMLKQPAERKSTSSSSSSSFVQASMPVKRPIQPGSARGGGRRGGLGVKRRT